VGFDSETSQVLKGSDPRNHSVPDSSQFGHTTAAATLPSGATNGAHAQRSRHPSAPSCHHRLRPESRSGRCRVRLLVCHRPIPRRENLVDHLNEDRETDLSGRMHPAGEGGGDIGFLDRTRWPDVAARRADLRHKPRTAGPLRRRRDWPRARPRCGASRSAIWAARLAETWNLTSRERFTETKRSRWKILPPGSAVPIRRFRENPDRSALPTKPSARSTKDSRNPWPAQIRRALSNLGRPLRDQRIDRKSRGASARWPSWRQSENPEKAVYFARESTWRGRLCAGHDRFDGGPGSNTTHAPSEPSYPSYAPWRAQSR